METETVTPECAPACAHLLRPLPGYPAQHADGCVHYVRTPPRGRMRDDDKCGCRDPWCGECMRSQSNWKRPGWAS